jgi:hypothetical protein
MSLTDHSIADLLFGASAMLRAAAEAVRDARGRAVRAEDALYELQEQRGVFGQYLPQEEEPEPTPVRAPEPTLPAARELAPNLAPAPAPEPAPEPAPVMAPDLDAPPASAPRASSRRGRAKAEPAPVAAASPVPEGSPLDGPAAAPASEPPRDPAADLFADGDDYGIPAL